MNPTIAWSIEMAAAHGSVTKLRPAESKERAAFESAVREQLERMLQSPHFDASARSRDFLCFVVDETLAGRGLRLNQAAIAVAVFGRTGNFDAILDPIVRVQAGRLRRSLERYYLLADTGDSIRIELTKGSYAPSFSVRQRSRAVTPWTPQAADARSDWPIVVVYPFDIHHSQDERTAIRIANELTTELLRYDQVRVVWQCDLERLEFRQHTTARFELRGDVYREGDDFLIGARLLDRTTAQQIWSDEYRVGVGCDRWPYGIDDAARIVAARIGSEHGVIARTLIHENRTRHQDAFSTYNAIVRARDFFVAGELEDLPSTIDAMEQAVRREPRLPAAWHHLARLYLLNHTLELSDRVTPVETAITYAERGASLDPGSALLRCTFALALHIKGELQAARDELDLASRFNGDGLAHLDIIGWSIALAGDWDRGVALMRDARRRNPYCLSHVQHGLWADHLRCDRYVEAHVAALEYQDGGWFWRPLMQACSLGLLGRYSEAHAHAAELLRLKPQFPQRGRTLIAHYIKSPELLERIIVGLDKAGLALRDEPQRAGMKR